MILKSQHHFRKKLGGVLPMNLNEQELLTKVFDLKVGASKAIDLLSSF